MRHKWMYSIGNYEIHKISIRPEDNTYKFPEFYHNKICTWYDVYGVKFLDHIYYILVSHIDN